MQTKIIAKLTNITLQGDTHATLFFTPLYGDEYSESLHFISKVITKSHPSINSILQNINYKSFDDLAKGPNHHLVQLVLEDNDIRFINEINQVTHKPVWKKHEASATAPQIKRTVLDTLPEEIKTLFSQLSVALSKEAK